MDNVKAIELLDNLIGMIDDNQNNDYDAAFRMAIDALKTQLYLEDATSDLISRQAAIELCDWYDNPSLHDDLEKLPSAQPEQRWIPCSERLPKKMGYYLTSNEYKVVHEDYYWGSGCFEKAKKYQCEVVAWMPMPISPYCGV